MPAQWTLDDVPWEKFDPAKVDPDLVKVVKAASMVESNGRDYAAYLCNVFEDDPDFQQAATDWAEEEVQHGVALGRWARMADESFDYETCFREFREGFKIDVGADASIRGSRTGELIARCMVEVGTSSYYTALADSAEEPVLKDICRKIAADELRHYRLFYKNMKRYLDRERLTLPRRMWVAVSRITETEDDELAYAYFAANRDFDRYDRKACGEAYIRRAYALYRPRHLERAMAMVFKAVGLDPQGRLSRTMSRGATWFMQHRVQKLAKSAGRPAQRAAA